MQIADFIMTWLKYLSVINTIMSLLIYAVFSSIHFNLIYMFIGVVLSYPGKSNGPPVWSSTYMVVGELKLPYAEIVEPFTGYFDAKNKKSRVDYYGKSFLITKTCPCNILQYFISIKMIIFK